MQGEKCKRKSVNGREREELEGEGFHFCRRVILSSPESGPSEGHPPFTQTVHTAQPAMSLTLTWHLPLREAASWGFIMHGSIGWLAVHCTVQCTLPLQVSASRLVMHVAQNGCTQHDRVFLLRCSLHVEPSLTEASSFTLLI